MSTGVRAELVLGAAQRGTSATAGPANNAFLQQRLSYDGEKLLDADARGVMMAWEGGASGLVSDLETFLQQRASYEEGSRRARTFVMMAWGGAASWTQWFRIAEVCYDTM